MKRRLRIKIPTWVKVALVLFVLLFGTQIPSCTMAYNPKFGRVVDVTTGKGIADVPVIAFATFNAAHLVHGSIQGCPYRVIAHTDADGRYWIPPMWLHARLGMPGTGPITRWQITAFKPGYAIEGDEKAWAFDEQYGWPKDHPASRAYSHPGLWLGLLVRVDPIQMKPVQLNLKEEAAYYKGVITAACTPDPTRDDVLPLRETAYAILLPKVCALDPSSEMDYTETDALSGITINRWKFSDHMKKLEPNMWGKEVYAHPKYRAGNVCEAMKAGGKAQ